MLDRRTTRSLPPDLGGNECSTPNADEARGWLPPFASLRAFDVIGRLGGIRKAALELGVDHGVVSRHLKALEEWAGITLLERGRGGRGQLTPEGSHFHARISAALEDIGGASRNLIERNRRERLLVWCSPGLACFWLLPLLDSFHASHPQIDLELRSTDFAPDLTRGEAMADLRFVGDWEPDTTGTTLETVDLARPDAIAVASPAFLGRYPPGLLAQDVPRLPLLHEEDDEKWRAFLTAQGIAAPRPLRGTRLWQAQLTIEAALRGQGVALANGFLVADHLRSGRLVTIKIGGQIARASIGRYRLTARKDRWRHPALEAFRTWVQSAMDTRRAMQIGATARTATA